MDINRTIRQKIEAVLFKGKVIIIYGARQVGKTFLVKQIQKKYEADSVYLNCDEPDVRASLTDKTSTELKSLFLGKKIIMIDEAQRVKNIGLTLKLIVDNFPDLQVVATGSSSFELSNHIVEPLTGRKYEFHLYPFSIEELLSVYSELETNRLLEERVVYGMYPEIILASDKKDRLKEIANSYTYKDILQFQKIRNSEAIEKLLQALALQIGSEVSYNELAQTVGVDKITVAKYIRILEQAFIIFSLRPFSRNLRNELKKMRKIYFYDTGVRNALINNLNPLSLRADVGGLWENYLISERIKYNSNHNTGARFWFWRTLTGKELDYLEENAGVIKGYEIKWTKEKIKRQNTFLAAYPGSELQLINRDNFAKFVV